MILADTTTPPSGPRDPRLLALANGPLVWATARGEDVGAMSDARGKAQQDARDEYRRLLYVAMTRAKERLVIAGTQGRNKIPDGCWYKLVEDALTGDCAAGPADDGEGDVLRYRKSGSKNIEAQTGKKKTLPAETKPASVPNWLRSNATSDTSALRTLTPSSAQDDAARPPATGGRAAALLRGALTHRLLQSLPDIPAGRRLKAAEDYLARAGRELTQEQRKKIAEEVLVLLDAAPFAALFAPGSRAEVPIVGRLMLGGEIVRVSGQIDRLAVTQSSVLIADFKTNRPAPRRIEEVPPAYVRQLALYRAVLQKLYPDKAVRAALIWTEVPDLMELSSEVLDAALALVTTAR